MSIDLENETILDIRLDARFWLNYSTTIEAAVESDAALVMVHSSPQPSTSKHKTPDKQSVPEEIMEQQKSPTLFKKGLFWPGRSTKQKDDYNETSNTKNNP